MNEELVKALRYCKADSRCGVCEWYKYCESRKRNNESCLEQLHDDAADALESAEKRIDGLQKLVDINTERCEALRKQLREAHENYEKHLNELEAQIPKEGEWIEHRSWGFSYASPITTNYHCSICDHEEPHNKYRYCPDCGARMRGEQE